MENTIKAKLTTYILPAAVGLIATVIASQVRTPAVEPLPPYSTTIYSSTPIGNGHFYSSGVTAYYAQAAPTPTPDPTGGGGVPLKS
jgi:hypothetical protein